MADNRFIPWRSGEAEALRLDLNALRLLLADIMLILGLGDLLLESIRCGGDIERREPSRLSVGGESDQSLAAAFAAVCLLAISR